MKKILFIFLLVFISFTYSCLRNWTQNLKLTRVEYLGKEIKTNGFYYNKKLFYYFFLFRNGVALGFSRANNTEHILSRWERLGHDTKFLNNYPPDWGVFQVESSKIKIERWVGGDIGRYNTKIYQGSILNDSTIILPIIPISAGKQDTFHFYPTSVRPDSTTRFIK